MKALQTRSSWIPMAWHAADKIIVVVGGGVVATRKVRQFLGRGALLRVVSPVLSEDLHLWAHMNELHADERPVETADLDGADLVILATDQPELQEVLEHYCDFKRIPCNRCDTGTGDFRTLSVLEHGDIQIGISTDGKSPALAARLRQELEHWLQEDMAELVHLLGALRDKIKQDIADPLERKALLRKASAYDIEALKRILDDEEDYSRFKGQ